MSLSVQHVGYVIYNIIQHAFRSLSITTKVIACLIVLPNSAFAAESVTSAGSDSSNHDNRLNITEKYNSGWAVYIDNDLFSSAETEGDYTGGLAVTLSGQRASAATKIEKGLFFIHIKR